MNNNHRAIGLKDKDRNDRNDQSSLYAYENGTVKKHKPDRRGTAWTRESQGSYSWIKIRRLQHSLPFVTALTILAVSHEFQSDLSLLTRQASMEAMRLLRLTLPRCSTTTSLAQAIHGTPELESMSSSSFALASSLRVLDNSCIHGLTTASVGSYYVSSAEHICHVISIPVESTNTKSSGQSFWRNGGVSWRRRRRRKRNDSVVAATAARGPDCELRLCEPPRKRQFSFHAGISPQRWIPNDFAAAASESWLFNPPWKKQSWFE
jgi:hypothetical protein